MVTPARRGPTAAPPTVSARLPVIHGSRDWMQGKSAKDMLNCGWLLRGNGDPKHWTHLVWMITDTSPIAMLAADTLANQGAVRKDLGSLTAKGACTHVCMHPDAKTGRPCGHTWHLKPKVTTGSKKIFAVDPSFSVFSKNCTSIQSSYVTDHIATKHGKITDTKLAVVQRQETAFKAAVASVGSSSEAHGQQGSIRTMLPSAPNSKAMVHTKQRVLQMQWYVCPIF